MSSTTYLVADPRTGDTRSVSRLRLGSRMLGNETSKGLRLMWVQKGPLVMQLALMAANYWIIQLFIGGGTFINDLLAMTFGGYLAWVAGYTLLLRMVNGLLEEMFTGTLEQSLLSPLRPTVQSLGRLAAALVESLVTAAAVTIVYLGIFAAMGVDLRLGWSVLLPALVTVLDLAGFALLIGGSALIINNIGPIVHVISMVLMFVNGAFLPVFVFPEGVEIAAKFMPSTLGVDAFRKLTTAEASLGDIWADGTLPWALIHAAVLLILGWVVYRAAIRRGLREGRLGS